MHYTNMKHTKRFVGSHVVQGMLGSVLSIGLTTPVRASVQNPVVTFTMPTAVDPAKLYLFVPGQLYTNRSRDRR